MLGNTGLNNLVYKHFKESQTSNKHEITLELDVMAQTFRGESLCYTKSYLIRNSLPKG